MTICKRFGALPLVVTVLLAASSPALLAQPDLTVTDLQGPAEAVTDARVQVSWTVLNQGSGLANAAWYDYVFFSTNDTWEAADDSLGYLYHNADLAVGSNYTATVTVTVPRVQAGTYYLIAWTERSAGVFEVDEGNNRRVIPFNIVVPDLTVTDLRSLTQPVAGQSAMVSWTVLNQGSGLADASWYDYVYFSTNDTWETTDDTLGYVYHTTDLAAGSNYTATVTVTVPPVLAGTNYLIVRTDRSTDLFEADETNNIRVVPWTGPPESPILSIRLVSKQAELSWPTSAVGFELESVAPLGAGAPWEAVTNAVNTVEDRNVCTVAPSASSRFYRLRKDESP